VEPSAKSVILDLLSSLRGREMPVRALLAAGALFDISADSMRVALARLLQCGTVERGARGQYRIAAAAQPVQRHVAGWTRIEERLAPWRGDWIGVHTSGLERGVRAARRRRERALRFVGFGALARDLWVRPDNLKGGVAAVRDELCALGLESAAPVFALSELDRATEERARALWDAAALHRRYHDMRTRLVRSAVRLEALPAPAAMVESFRLGGEAIRLLALDPLLPEPIVAAAERTALVETMRGYDRLGRTRWRPFMQAHGAPHLHAPRAAVESRWPSRVASGAVGA
jgi:phenylacetic acid degradation operon negative regulatory protein